MAAEITEILRKVEQGDRTASNELLPLVYRELRQLAAIRLAREPDGQTLQATALVHEAYVRLSGSANPPHGWEGRGHFFAAAAEAMRRIVVENARRKQRIKRGGKVERNDVDVDNLILDDRDPAEVLGISEAIAELHTKHPRKAELVKLRYYLGCTVDEASEILEVSVGTVEADWRFARAWLRRRLGN